jgi:flagellar hook-length control protein FliK
MAAAEVPAGDVDVSDAFDDEDAALMALAECLPGPVPALPSIPAAIDGSPELAVSSEPQVSDPLVGRILSGPTDEPGGLARQANEITASAPEGASEERVPAGLPVSVPTGEAEKLAPHVNAIHARAPEESVPAGLSVSAPAGEPETLTPQANVAHKSAGMVAQPPQTRDVQPEARAAAIPQQQSPVDEQPQEPTKELTKVTLAGVTEVAPSGQQTGRTRETLVAKLAEMTGAGQGVEVATKPAPGTNLAGDSQSQAQDGKAQDAFATGIVELTAEPSADSVEVAPVFTVAPQVHGAARVVVVEGAALPQASSAATVPDPQNVGRLIESMRVQMRDGVQEATVRLKPEHMGEVTISIRVERGAVSAVVHAETPAVQQWLESQEDKLRAGLSDQGLHLERFIVHRDRSHERREPQRQQQPAPRYKQPRDESTVRFEVLV